MSRGASANQMRRTPALALFFVACIPLTSFAQEPPPPTPPPTVSPAPEPQPQPEPAPVPAPAPGPPAESPSVLSRAAGASYDRRETIPNVNIYLPEGQADVRLRKLIKNVLFESQISYRFINGDISAYLRYKYYAKSFTYKISVFDTIEFDVPAVGASGGSKEFQRVRGGLLLMEFPRDYNHRYYWLLQDDRLSFGEVTRADNRKNNVYTKLGFQYGTQFDEHLNQIVGETRGHILPVLTAFREIGPQKWSIAAAVTQSAEVYTGDYRYTKIEAETLRRFDLTPTSFIVTRAHIGTFPFYTDIPNPVAPLPDPRPQIERYSVPEYEMFSLGGRQALRSVKNGPNFEGTGLDEYHATAEYFVPVFRNRDYPMWISHWNTLYAIGYAGAGAVGYKVDQVKNPAADLGLGAEASITVRDFEVLLSVLAAHTFSGPEEIRGSSVKFSIRTVH
jgi:hypothetical protein